MTIENFIIPIKGHTFVVSLDGKQIGLQTFVQTNLFRPEECSVHRISPSSPIAPAVIGEQNFTLRDEFEHDLNDQIQWINDSPEKPSSQVFFDACCNACQQHIARHGRLLISDMFTYLDIFALLLNVCFGQTKQVTTHMYRECTKVLGHALNQYVQYPGPYGVILDFDTWARKNGL